jgi:hypothetical protein
LRNSGASALWAMQTTIDGVLGDLSTVDNQVGLATIALEQLKGVFSPTHSYPIEWQSGKIILRTPAILVGPYNPFIVVQPVLAPLPNQSGRGAVYIDGDVIAGKADVDAPNWIFTGGVDEYGAPLTWFGAGASDPRDVDVDAAFEFPLFKSSERTTDWVELELPLAVLQGLLNGTYSGLRFSLRFDEEAQQSILREYGVNSSFTEPFVSDALKFANDFSRNQLLTPMLELQSFEQTLDRSSAFNVDAENLIGVTLRRAGAPALPSNLYEGATCTLVARLSLFYDTYIATVNQDGYGELPGAVVDVANSYIYTTTQINPDALDSRLVDLYGFTTAPHPDSFPEDIYEGGELNYNHPEFYNFWHSPLNESFRNDRQVVTVLGDTTLRDGLLEGSNRFKLDLVAIWTLAGKKVAEREIRPRDLDPFGSSVIIETADVYPRITTSNLKRSWSKDENPQRVNVFVDDRPPQRMANATYRRNQISRTSGVFDDLAWGIVPSAQLGAGSWIVKPSEATLLSHDGSYHWFWFDPNMLPRGSWRFEFVRLNDGAALRQINPVNFSVSGGDN